jgi:hypothetical protein
VIDLHYHHRVQRAALILPIVPLLVCLAIDWQGAFAVALLAAAAFELALLISLTGDLIPSCRAPERYERLGRMVRDLAPQNRATQEQRVHLYGSSAARLFVRGLWRPRLYCTTALLERVSDEQLRGMVALALGWAHRLQAAPEPEPSDALGQHQHSPGEHPRPAWWSVFSSGHGLPNEHSGPEPTQR